MVYGYIYLQEREFLCVYLCSEHIRGGSFKFLREGVDEIGLLLLWYVLFNQPVSECKCTRQCVWGGGLVRAQLCLFLCIRLHGKYVCMFFATFC